ncbi:Reverse transcriptase zinc-binding domain [Arabidopsis thaliana x Arabidopsis arenosa]|uniref:Reverse transcriptase zinc-binding domain n=1 Tax=Arabidopsis thaliana x Arabidopsis arenosa TaxID=1240361 RepID=A0A8T1Z2U2_9BRAS|nr:Reverse transcriptase zinc-binding domain [Arabidopsis thaliana x Arabidopsis arenosa]
MVSMLPSLNGIKEQIWKLLAPSKIKIFIWKAISGAIPVAERLSTRGMVVDQRCHICGLEGESINHILFTCSLSRQIWALSGLPLPDGGFDPRSIYQNLFHVILMCKNSKVPVEVRRSPPWILWSLWKNRNSLFFEGLVSTPKDILLKFKEDSAEWFQAQVLESQETVLSNIQTQGYIHKWRPPPKPWLKCNVASSWNKEKKICGVAWVLRNSEGIVLLHSRAALPSISSKGEAELQGCIWAIKDMQNLHIHKVIFAFEPNELAGAVLRPAAWPSFKSQSECLLLALSYLPAWRVVHEDRKCNLGAALIARSVTREERFQSYVASGYLFWLQKVFNDDICITSV